MRRLPLILLLTGTFLAGGIVTWLVQRARSPQATQSNAASAVPSAAERKVLYWYDPMVPQQHFDQPGKSPFMDMQLVPKYADGAGDADTGTVTIEPRLVQNLGVRTALAQRGKLARGVRATGAVAFDERAVAVVSAPVAAIVERLHVRAPLDPVAAGDPLFTLLAPDWTAAQEEYLALRRARAPGLDSLKAAARQRLILIGMPEGHIRALERRGVSNPRIVVTAPTAGVIGELGVREGASVMPGTLLARLNGLDTVWINAAVPEREAAAIGRGAEVTATVPALPGRSFAGHVEALLASVDPMTRTLTARVVLDNADRALTPGMFAHLELTPTAAARERVLLPGEAVITTGTRSVVIVAESKGRFRAQEVRVGDELGGQTEILEGIAAGERVVLSGQFLIDSEASLSGALARLGEPAREPAPKAAGAAMEAMDSMASDTIDSPDTGEVADEDPAQHLAEGTIKRIEARRLTIATGPIPSLEMPAMTMTFVAPPAQDLSALTPGTRVSFGFVSSGSGEFEIRSIAVLDDRARREGDTP